MQIYTITTLRRNTYNTPCRCVGWFDSYENAMECVENNCCDIAEDGWYQYAVIEPVDRGIYGTANTDPVYWFEWIDDKWIKIDCPSQHSRTFGFGIG